MSKHDADPSDQAEPEPEKSFANVLSRSIRNLILQKPQVLETGGFVTAERLAEASDDDEFPVTPVALSTPEIPSREVTKSDLRKCRCSPNHRIPRNSLRKRILCEIKSHPIVSFLIIYCRLS